MNGYLLASTDATDVLVVLGLLVGVALVSAFLSWLDDL